MKKPVTIYSPNPKSYKDLSEVVQGLHNRIFSIYRHSPVQRLEKSVLRGEGMSQKSKHIAHKPAPSLLPDHQLSYSGFQIMNLPKQPFGKHKPYNESRHFISDHFVSPDAESRSKFNFSGLVRKMKTAKKNSHSASKSAYNPLFKSNNLNKDVFKTKAGNLICKKQKKIMQLYDEQVNRQRPKMQILKIFDDDLTKLSGRQSCLSSYSQNSIRE